VQHATRSEFLAKVQEFLLTSPALPRRSGDKDCRRIGTHRTVPWVNAQDSHAANGEQTERGNEGQRRRELALGVDQTCAVQLVANARSPSMYLTW
jgi:hypothetical protein